MLPTAAKRIPRELHPGMSTGSRRDCPQDFAHSAHQRGSRSLQLNFTHCVFCVFLPIPFHPLPELSVHRLEEGRKAKPRIRTPCVTGDTAVKEAAALTVLIVPQGFGWLVFAINTHWTGRQKTTVV